MEKYIGKSKEYKHVYVYQSDTIKNTYYKALVSISGLTKRKGDFKTEIEAAKWVDMTLIRNGKEPVNILKRK